MTDKEAFKIRFIGWIGIGFNVFFALWYANYLKMERKYTNAKTLIFVFALGEPLCLLVTCAVQFQAFYMFKKV